MPDDDYGSIAVEIANEMERICSDRPTASVYLAIGMMLGAMEARATNPARARTFHLLGKVMDDQIRKNEN